MPIPQPTIDFSSFTLADVPSRPEPFRLLNKVPIIDNGEPLVDLRETNPELSFSDYCLPYVREGVAEALKAATCRLPDHLDLRVFTALRTLEQQAEMYWGNYKRAKEEHPDWPESVVRKMTNRFFAPPDAKAPPGHCTGGAVDVGLILRESDKGIDVSSPIEGWKAAPTLTKGLSPEAAENRRLLCFLMHSTGLSNCRDEFWHWSYGDSAWAVRLQRPVACYGLIAPPEGATRVAGGKVTIEAYNDDWPRQFETIRTGLIEQFGVPPLAIEHVGSTSVPGLAAKPILDIDIVVKNPGAMTDLIRALGEIGYEHQGDLGISGREAFRRKTDSAFKDAICQAWPTHHLYACEDGSRELRRHLAFRDYLRRNPSARDAYADLKRQLASRYPWNRDKYSEGKTSFVVELLREMDSSLVE